MNRIRVLVVEADAAWREATVKLLEGCDDIEVVGVVVDEHATLRAVARVEPDVVVLSTDVRATCASELASRLVTADPDLGVIVFAGEGGDAEATATECMEVGAFEVVNKPAAFDELYLETVGRQLLLKIRTFSTARFSRLARGLPSATPLPRPSGTPLPRSASAMTDPALPLAPRPRSSPPRGDPPELVVIGASTGGPDALAQLIDSLPADFPVPVVAIVHMLPTFTKTLAASLDRRGGLPVTQCSDGQALRAPAVVLAPGGRHLVIERGLARALVARLDDGPPENGCRPSVDVLFRSAARVCGARVVGVVLTGMGNDGSDGVVALERAGARVVAQDEASSVVWGMPGSAVQAGGVHDLLPLPEIGPHLVRLVGAR